MNYFKLFFGRENAEEANEVNYDHGCQRIIDLLDREDVFNGYISDDVDAKLWLPEMNSVNVTILCDKFFRKQHIRYGLIALVTDKGDINCLSVLNIEQQSSGFKRIKQLESGNKAILVMGIKPDKIKSELLIPNNYVNGFVWGNEQKGRLIASHRVPTSKYNCNYILNFSVSGEFNLDICYIPLNHAEPILMFSKAICCK